MIMTELIIAILLPVLGFPFLVGAKRPSRFRGVVLLYANAAFAIYMLLWIADSFYQIGQFHTLSKATGVADPEKIDSLIIEIWNWAYAGCCLLYFAALWIFGHFIVSDS